MPREKRYQLVLNFKTKEDLEEWATGTTKRPYVIAERDALHEHCEKGVFLTKKFNVKLIINDSPEIAKKVNADGCHLGQLDTDISKAKKILKKKIIGVTCHGSIKLVNEAIKDKPSYIAVGSFYKSKLKPKAKKANIKIIKKIRKRTKIPVVAIGGINDKNYKKLTRKGANYIAISSFIWDNPFLKPGDAIKKFIK